MINALGISARIDAVCHKILHPRHKIIWRFAPDELCPGDIVCDTCDIIFWCRALDRKNDKKQTGRETCGRHY